MSLWVADLGFSVVPIDQGPAGLSMEIFELEISDRNERFIGLP